MTPELFCSLASLLIACGLAGVRIVEARRNGKGNGHSNQEGRLSTVEANQAVVMREIERMRDFNHREVRPIVTVFRTLDIDWAKVIKESPYRKPEP